MKPIIYFLLFWLSLAEISIKQWHHDSYHSFGRGGWGVKHCGDTDFHAKCEQISTEASAFVNENSYTMIDLDHQRGMSQDMDSFSCFCTVTLVYDCNYLSTNIGDHTEPN